MLSFKCIVIKTSDRGRSPGVCVHSSMFTSLSSTATTATTTTDVSAVTYLQDAGVAQLTTECLLITCYMITPEKCVTKL